MRVLYDSQAFDMQTHGGVSRCFIELVENMPSDIKPQLSVVETENEYLKQIGYPKSGELYERFLFRKEFPCKGRLFDLYYNKVKSYHYGYNQNRQYSIELLKKGKFDVFHPTYFDDYFLEHLHEKPFVLTIHDMIPELFPEYYDRENSQILMKRKLAPLASAIIAVSEQTKKDVIDILNVPTEKIHVVYHGSNLMKEEYKDCERLFSFKYVLYVGDRYGYKNFRYFVDESSLFLRDHKDIKVVCTGKPFTSDEVDLITNCGVSNQFIQYFVKDDKDFYSIYKNAIAFVYPSAYEGFGIPILEAYQAQCPVLLNNASCFPEIAKDAAIYFEMNSNGETDLHNKLEYIYCMSEEDRNSLIKKQDERLSMFSWKTSAAQLADVYKSVI